MAETARSVSLTSNLTAFGSAALTAVPSVHVTSCGGIDGSSDEDDDCSLQKGGGGEASTLATMIGSECEMFSSSRSSATHTAAARDDCDERGGGGHGDNHAVEDDSCSTFSDRSEHDIHETDATVNSPVDRTALLRRTRIPSSVHLPFCDERGREEEKEEETPPREGVEPRETVYEPAVATSVAPQEPATPITPPPRAPSQEPVFKYTPRLLHRSQSMILPRTSLLKRTSAYSVDTSIPLDFEKRGSVKVLPKPDPALLRLAQLPARNPQQHRQMLRSSCSFRSLPLPPLPRQASVPKLRRQVSFDKIQVREHRRTIGDNPSCSYGTPVSLDWESLQLEDLSFDAYETHKYSANNGRRGRPRSLREMHLNHYQRRNLLQLEGYSLEEIKAQKKVTNKDRKQREATRLLAQLSVLIRVEDLVESTGRKVRRMLGGQRDGGGGCGTNGGAPHPLQKPPSTKELLKLMAADHSHGTVGTSGTTNSLAHS